MLDGEDMVVETAARMLSRSANPKDVTSDPHGDWRKQVWSELVNADIVHAWAPEAVGGGGGSLGLGFALAREAGRVALSIPLCESMLAGWLLGWAGLSIPDGPLTVAPVHPSSHVQVTAGKLHGEVSAVPFAREVDHLVVLGDGPVVAIVSAAAAMIEPEKSLAGDPADHVNLEGVVPDELAPVELPCANEKLMMMGSLLRSMQIAGALESMLDLVVEYASQRIAFGRPISKFQAIQQSIATMACEVAAAATAAPSAAAAVDDAGGLHLEDDGVFLEVTAAKVRCAEAAANATRIAHQVHGAIGVSAEHVLHRFTLRSLAWRDDFGDESYWAVELGRRIARMGDEALWPLLASR